MASTLILSLNHGSRAGRFRPCLAMLMLACAFTLALSTAIFKVFAIQGEFWTTTAWTSVGQALFGLLFLLQASTWRQLIAMAHGGGALVAMVNAANEVINLAGSLSQRYALVLAPFSLVQAVGSTAPLFVFLFGVALSLINPRLVKGDLSPWTLLAKATAAVLVVAGVSLIGE